MADVPQFSHGLLPHGDHLDHRMLLYGQGIFCGSSWLGREFIRATGGGC